MKVLIKTLIPKKLIRKREVLVSKVSMYIVIIIVLCHSVRLIPTIWEISRTFLEKEEEADPWSDWPPWVDTVTGLSHLTLTISCSPSFYIYYALYGTRNKEGNTVNLYL